MLALPVPGRVPGLPETSMQNTARPYLTHACRGMFFFAGLVVVVAAGGSAFSAQATEAAQTAPC